MWATLWIAAFHCASECVSYEKTIKLVLFLCIAGVALFGYRGVYRSLDPETNWDAQLLPMGGRVWLQGWQSLRSAAGVCGMDTAGRHAQ
jgi:uncharacterized membrane protein YgdD (TMEM256/DUF423 family)